MVQRGVLRQAATWPWHECLVARDWDKEGEIVQILLARRGPAGQLAAGSFLVDLGCLGVKSAFAKLFLAERDYEAVRQQMMSRQPMVKTDPNLAAKIVREAVAYARQLGFKPDPDYHDAAILLQGTDPDACPARVPLGKDGKPFFVAGPYDDVPRIMAKLERAVGRGKFDVVAPLAAPLGLFPEFDELEFEDEDEDDDEDEEE